MSAAAIVFVGPTLPAAEVKRLLPGCEVRPPARQGDVWRALLPPPRVLVLLDGVFESAPSVWHRELRTALECGVTVFGAASMGALRAVELAPFGMVGVGSIFRAYRDGALIDDAEVALLHASAEHGHRPLSLPLVNVRHAAEQARIARLLTRAQATKLVRIAESVFYQERHWAGLLRAVHARWPKNVVDRFRAWLPQGAEDLKAKDGRECLAVAREFLERTSSPRTSGQRATAIGPRSRPSSLVRRSKLAARTLAGERADAGDAPADASTTPAGALMESARDGLRRRVIAGWARTLGLRVDAADLRAQEDAWFKARRVVPARRSAFLARLGMDPLDAERLFEDFALEEKVLSAAPRMLPDGPSMTEAVASATRRKGQVVTAR